MDTTFVIVAFVVVLALWLWSRQPKEQLMFYGPYIRPSALMGAVALDYSTVMDAKIANQPFIYNPTFWRQYPGSYETCIKQCATRRTTYPPYLTEEIDPTKLQECAETCAYL